MEPNGGGDQRDFCGTLFLPFSKGATSVQKLRVLRSIEFQQIRYYIRPLAPDPEIQRHSNVQKSYLTMASYPYPRSECRIQGGHNWTCVQCKSMGMGPVDLLDREDMSHDIEIAASLSPTITASLHKSHSQKQSCPP